MADFLFFGLIRISLMKKIGKLSKKKKKTGVAQVHETSTAATLMHDYPVVIISSTVQIGFDHHKCLMAN